VEGGEFLAAIPIGFVILRLSSLAECERLPFDLPEADRRRISSGLSNRVFLRVSNLVDFLLLASYIN